MLNAVQRRFLESCRVAHLATADAAGWPHVVPVCFASVDNSIYIVLDEKPKKIDGRALKRLRNIYENPRAALIADRYDDNDWTRLGWVMLRGPAVVLEPGQEQARAISRLRDRYPQYLDMALDDSPVIVLRIERVVGWGDLGP